MKTIILLKKSLTKQRVGLKINQSEGYHTYSLLWGNLNNEQVVKFAVDGMVVLEASENLRHTASGASFNILFLAQDQLPKDVNFTEILIRDVVYTTGIIIILLLIIIRYFFFIIIDLLFFRIRIRAGTLPLIKQGRYQLKLISIMLYCVM